MITRAGDQLYEQDVPTGLAPGALIGAVVLALALPLAAVVLAAGALSDLTAAPASAGPGTSALARADIPPAYLRLYMRAAARYGLDWSILAGIGKVECDHGRDPSSSCGQEGAVNSAGAGGPMQFLAATWAHYGADGDGDGRRDRWDAADAIFGAASYLRASGAPLDYERAIMAYNHVGWYVAEVESWAARYRSGAETVSVGGATPLLTGSTSTPVVAISGSRARLEPGDGHVAMIPAEAPPAVQAMLVAGNELQDLPYGPAGHPDPLGAASEDCSSTVSYVLYRSGVRGLGEILRDDPIAQEYVGWGDPGPGRWVTIYATDEPTPHVFIVIAGLRLDTSHDGTDDGPNRGQDGPRWRIFPSIPTWARWSVRHPRGM